MYYIYSPIKTMSFRIELEKEINKHLPGTDVQWEMASSDRLVRGFPREPQENSLPASVLILLYPVNGKINTIFIQRPEYEGIHGGQISFPGGKREPSDSDPVATAIREASEETGIIPGNVKIIGILTPLYIPVSNIIVTPVAGWAEMRPDFIPRSSEVDFIIEAELSRFLSFSILKTRPFQIRGEMIDIRYFDYEGHIIWGATAMILNELLEIIRRANLDLKE
jgi:8-oxo-dGTP pyrophosphatase MutT (NUDIX family)